MREFHTQKSRSGLGRYRTLVTALAVLLLGGAGFAAAGGVQAVKKWFITVELIGPDGAIYEGVVLEPVEADENGMATTTVDLGDGRQATLVLQKVNVGADTADGSVQDGEMTSITVSLTGNDASGEKAGVLNTERIAARGAVLLQELGSIDEVDPALILDRGVRKAFAARNSAPLREIDPAEWIEEWVDENGDVQELHIVREDNADVVARGFRVFKTVTGNDGEILYKQIGFLGIDPDKAEISSVEVDENGLATVRVLASNGAEAVMELDTRRQAPREAGTVSITISAEKGDAEVDLRKPNNSDE